MSLKSRGRPPKTQNVCDQLRAMAWQLGAGARFPTAAQLRQELGVSFDTLNAALGELERQNLIERRSGVGVYVAPRLQYQVAMVFDPSFFQGAGHSPFWDILVSEMRQRADSTIFSMHFAPPNAHEPLDVMLRQQLATGQIQGVIGSVSELKTIEAIEESDVPFVRFGGVGKNVVHLDYRAMIFDAVRALKREGRRKIGLWKFVRPHVPAPFPQEYRDEIEQMFEEALREIGLKFRPGLVKNNRHLRPRVGDVTQQTQQEQGFYTAREVFSGPEKERPDAVVITDDLMTRGALTALHKLGVGVGPEQELCIATQSNACSPILLGHEDELIRLEYDPAEVASTLFNNLHALMSGRRKDVSTRHIAPRLLPAGAHKQGG
jgi:DNA-binding LacI/PurR family transcriptional regulator